MVTEILYLIEYRNHFTGWEIWTAPLTDGYAARQDVKALRLKYPEREFRVKVSTVTEELTDF